MSEITRADVAILRRMLALARDLMQAPNINSLLAMVAPALHEVLSTDRVIVTAQIGDHTTSVSFDLKGLDLKPTDDGFNKCVGQAYFDQKTILLTDVSSEYDIQGTDTKTTERGSLLAVPFPDFEPFGALGAFWNGTLPSQSLQQKIGTVRQIGDLLGAAIGNIESKQLMENQISLAHEKADHEAQEHAFEIKRRNRIEDEIRLLSLTDVLTGSLNRRGFFVYAEQSFKMVRRKKLPSAVVFMDIDGLKAVNDQFGHDEGDNLIKDSANILRNCFRDSDVVARIGGDEFAVFTVETSSSDVLLSRVLTETKRFNGYSAKPYRVSFSTGIVPCDPTSNVRLSEYLAMADRKMYAQKLGG